jgi:biotin carboxylase
VVRVWFNRTYATTAHVAQMLRDNPAGRPVTVVGSHSDPDSPVLAGCDESFLEPALTGPAYVDWALEFARTHRIDVLVPRLAMAELADERAGFEAAGTVLAAPDAATVRLFEDKAAAYRAAGRLGLPVPPHHVVTDGAGLRAAHDDLQTLGLVCVKPVRGVGGAGFRVLTTAPPSLDELAEPAHLRMDLDRLCAALDSGNDAGNDAGTAGLSLLVTPYLTGREVSVDAVADRDGRTLAAIGRLATRRRRHILDDAPARAVAERLNAAHRVSFLSNTQVRYWQGPGDAEPQPYLLELNTRASGGLFQTALAGVNLPWAALQIALGEPVEPLTPSFGAAFTTVAALVPLDPTA